VSTGQVEEAVANARSAFNGPWSRWRGEQRAQALYKLADLMDENAQAIAYLESIASGRLISMLQDEVGRTSNALRCKFDRMKAMQLVPGQC
jgi:acyl-CoA reductase-like NAD-dependent aldehyde dehydrogenase